MLYSKLTPQIFVDRALSARNIDDLLDANVGLVALLSRHFQYEIQVITDNTVRLLNGISTTS